MELYKVLLVDDEEDVRESIVKKLDWHSLGFEVAGQASNGQEALEIAETLLPDVIMTDIKMPFMDGLELCRRVRRLLPRVRIAVFSGFDEFEYAREAITQQVEEYILKPIDAEELSAVFRRLKRSLDEEIAARRDVARLRRYYEESLPLMRQQVLMALLEGSGGDDAEQQAGQYGLELAADGCCVAVVCPVHDETGADGALMTYSLRQLVEDTIGTRLRREVLQLPDGLVLLFLLDGDVGVRRVMTVLDRLFATSRKLLGLRLSIGVGKRYGDVRQAAQSYTEARDALDYQILTEPGACIYIGDIEPGGEGDDAPDPAYTDELLRQIKIGHTEGLRAAVDAFVRTLRQEGRGMRYYQVCLLELSTELLKLARSYRLDGGEARLDELLEQTGAHRFSNLDELGRWLFDYCDNLRQTIRRERKDTARLLVDRARELLAQSYADSELSLDSICSALNVSGAYFSTLFKRETGQGFVSYLTALRMEKALELLATTDDKTYQIAEKVGYADPNYFSYVFKRQYGLSPSRYKADRMGSDGQDTQGASAL